MASATSPHSAASEGTFCFVARNIATISYIIDNSTFGKILSKEQRMFAAALLDTFSYVEQGRISVTDLSRAVRYARAGVLCLFPARRIHGIVETGQYQDITNLAMQIEALIFSAEKLGNQQELIDMILEEKGNISSVVNETFSAGRSAPLFAELYGPVLMSLEDPNFQKIVLSSDAFAEPPSSQKSQIKQDPVQQKPSTQAPRNAARTSQSGKCENPSSGNRGQKGKLPTAVLAVALCFVIIILLLPYFFPTASSGSDDPSVSDAAIESAASSTKPSLPKNQSASAGKRTYTPVKAEDGELLICPSYEQICPFKIVVSYSDQQNKDFFVFLEYVCPFPEGSSEKDVVSFVEKGGLYSSATDTRTQSKLQEWKARNKPSIPVVDDIGVYLSTSTAFSFDVPPGCYRIWYCSGETWYGLNHYFGDNTVWHTSDDILTFYYDSEYVYGQTISLMLVADGNFDTYIASDSELPDALK